MRVRWILMLMMAVLAAGCDQQRPGAPVAAVMPLPPPPSPSMPAPSPAIGAVVGRPAPQPAAQQPRPERFANRPANGFRSVAEEPVSTISLASDTASYSIARRMLRAGLVPPRQAVRPEEFLNAFRYDYPVPSDRARPLAPFVSVHPAPWDATRQLLHIGIRAMDVARTERPNLNLTFLIDVSGSMFPADRLPLITGGIRMLLPQLTARDRVSIVTYAGRTAVLLDSARGDSTAEIEAALEGLRAGGGTAGASGIEAAYQLASRNFARGAVNRVILATDGDFNLGISDPRALEALIKSHRDRGIYLTAIGVGLDNLTDTTMHALARAGNGIYAYAGDAADTHRILIDDFTANILPVANDVKLEVEFNPAVVQEYRLIGFETRALRREDFNNDQVDAGEIGSGRSITAIYELIGPGRSLRPGVDPLRYGREAAAPAPGTGRGQEIAFLRIRFNAPGQRTSQLVTRAVTAPDVRASFSEASTDARFAAAVVGFAQVLRGADAMPWSFAQAAEVAQAARGEDPDGRRAEFVGLARLAASLPALRP